jgi:transcriptional regulator with XRE-family HTH domain
MKASDTEINAFYHKIDELCVRHGITHRQLAEECGISEVTLCRYLLGERSIQLMPFMAMCRALKISPEDLYSTYLYARMEKRVAKYRAEHEG